MSEIRRRLDEQVKAGRLYEVCRRCVCGTQDGHKFHKNVHGVPMCTVCWTYHPYEPAWIIRPQPKPHK